MGMSTNIVDMTTDYTAFGLTRPACVVVGNVADQSGLEPKLF
ncbi:hypothetical protein BOSE127_50238 [Bosea sp. 127]|nr:hypothetical protein BOSE127_50238 [Bosea sp. 127]